MTVAAREWWEKGQGQIGEAWLGAFAQSPEVLYTYHDDTILQYRHDLSIGEFGVPQTMEEERLYSEAKKRAPAPVASDIIGMGTWKLGGVTDRVIAFMVARVEGCWRESCENDLTLYPAEHWKQQGWDFADSMDPERQWDGFANVDIPDPVKGDPGYPRLQLENRIYCSRVFRKLHVEVGARQDGLHVMHIILYPRYEFDLPILAFDLVLVNGVVTLAIIDAVPVRADLALPGHYSAAMQMLQATFLDPPDSPGRTIPQWGANIFSEHCVCLRPSGPAELTGFVKYALALHKAHMLLADRLQPIRVTDAQGQARAAEVLDCHKRFTENNLSNLKTRRVLDVAFGTAWSDAYMRSVMFDFKPEYQPAFNDTSILQLFDYFEDNPAVLTEQEELRDLRSDLRVEEASEVVERAYSRDTMKRGLSSKKLEKAMLDLYTGDEAFRDSVRALLPGADELQYTGQLGGALLGMMEELGMGPEAANPNAHRAVS
ncbi:MAG: hypothetical protein WDW36_003571 [Sanguina aurantia]